MVCWFSSSLARPASLIDRKTPGLVIYGLECIGLLSTAIMTTQTLQIVSYWIQGTGWTVIRILKLIKQLLNSYVAS